MSRNIVLVGLMGSGKTTIGRFIAHILGREFIDTDEVIENETRKSINTIFKMYGESLFRKLEAKTVNKVSVNMGLIIATGGGVVENVNNIDNLKKTGVVFYLQAPPQELYKRLRGEHDRPLLNNRNALNTLKTLLARREKFYNLADVKIDTVDKPSYDIVKEIIENYKKHEE